MKNKISEELLNEMIDYLKGTCMSLSDGCNLFDFKEEDLTLDQLRYIDEEIFFCEQCGWCYPICEKYGEGLCEECYIEELELTEEVD